MPSRQSSSLTEKFKHPQLLQNEPLSNYTTLKVGGPADFLLKATHSEEIITALTIARNEGLPVQTIGRGSNLLVSDKGFRGLVLQIAKPKDCLIIDDPYLRIHCGRSLPGLTRSTVEAGLGGLEWAGGIPGTIGGAVKMNAGAFGGRISDILENIFIVDENLAYRKVSANDLQFDYRTSSIDDRWIMLEVEMCFGPTAKRVLEDQVSEYKVKRRQTQPMGVYSAGCIFKNPSGDSAGRLIDQAGLKGCSQGGAFVSLIHANFICHKGNASAEDIYALIQVVREKVETQTGISLELEVNLIGFSNPL